MKRISVDFTLSDEEEKRLEAITENYNKRENDYTTDEVFRGIMLCGSKWNIKDKLTFAERQAGIISYEDYNKKKDSWKYEKCNR